jgi:hypothetical protein
MKIFLFQIIPLTKHEILTQNAILFLFNLGFPRSKWLMAQINRFLSKLKLCPAGFPHKKVPLVIPERKILLAKTLTALSVLTFALATAAMLQKIEPFYSVYYSFAWWSYIIFIQSFLYPRGGNSLLFKNGWEFLILSLFSTTVWLIFETINFRLSNWHYINIPSNIVMRWAGYPIAYSTVLPGIFSTFALLDFLGILKNSKCNSLPNPHRLYLPFLCTGTVFFTLPLIWPQIFFPLVWGTFIFLLEPLNHKFGAPSLLRDWENGSLRKFYLLLLSGVVCGLLWEMWNFKAGAKWVYSIPYVGILKIFEMPILGFLGFPAFVVECYAMTAAFFLLIGKIKRNCSTREALGLYAIVALLVVVFDLLVFAGIDRFTITSFIDYPMTGSRY